MSHSVLVSRRFLGVNTEVSLYCIDLLFYTLKLNDDAAAAADDDENRLEVDPEGRWGRSPQYKRRAVLSPGNRAKPCKFRYVKSVRNFMWKLCYRKDDRAMRPRPIRGCPENFRDSLTTPTATIPKIFHGFLFRLILWMFLQNLKSVALPVPEIRGGS